MKPKVSIIIRSKNEERWIRACLTALAAQSYRDFEVVLVDNESTDRTVSKARALGVTKVVPLTDYLPGKAINAGIDAAEGEYIVLLSAHCLPTDSHWLGHLVRNLDEDEKGEIAGVYGRQEPMSFTDPLDKRDLYITFGLDRRVQVKDTFFHNANSIVRRSVLSTIPFDGKVTNIEDRVWGRQVIAAGYKIVYEPQASVYHYHGIHQGADRRRAKNIIRIMQTFEEGGTPFEQNYQLMQEKVAAVITARGEPEPFCGKTLVEYAIESAKQCRWIHTIYVATDNPATAELATLRGAQVPFLRSAESSKQGVGVESVLKEFLSKLEETQPDSPDIVVYLSTNQPFRRAGMLDRVIERLFSEGLDSVMPAVPTFKSCWVEEGEDLRRVDEGFVARNQKRPLHVAHAGLGCATHVSSLRQGRLLGERVGLLEILDGYETIEVRDVADRQLAEKVFPEWWKERGQTP